MVVEVPTALAKSSLEMLLFLRSCTLLLPWNSSLEVMYMIEQVQVEKEDEFLKVTYGIIIQITIIRNICVIKKLMQRKLQRILEEEAVIRNIRNITNN